MRNIKEVATEAWQNWLDRMAELMGSSSFAYSAWHTSLMMTLWGIWLLLPGNTFDGSAYAYMDMLASEFAWGAVATLLGASKMHFVIYKRPISLATLSLISGYFWVIVGISFLASNPDNTGSVVYIMLGLYDFWLYKRLMNRKD